MFWGLYTDFYSEKKAEAFLEKIYLWKKSSDGAHSNATFSQKM